MKEQSLKPLNLLYKNETKLLTKENAITKHSTVRWLQLSDENLKFSKNTFQAHQP